MSWWAAYRIKMITPLFVSVMLMLFSYGNAIFKKRRLQQPSSINILAALGSFIGFLLFVVIAIYSFVTAVSLSPFNCRQVGPNKFVVSTAVEITCYDDVWYSHIPEAVIFLVFYFLICPIAIVTILFYFHRKKSLTSDFERILYRHAFSSLTQPYRERMYFWELVTTVKRLMFVFCSTLFDSFGYIAKILITIIMLFAFAWIESATVPYTRRNWAKISWNFVLILILLSQGLLFELQKEEKALTNVGQSILVVLIIVMVFTCLLTNIYNVLKDRILKCNKLDKMLRTKVQIPESVFYGLQLNDMSDISISFNEEILEHKGYLKMNSQVFKACLSESAWSELMKFQEDFTEVPGHKSQKGASTEPFDGSTINLPDVIAVPTAPKKAPRLSTPFPELEQTHKNSFVQLRSHTSPSLDALSANSFQEAAMHKNIFFQLKSHKSSSVDTHSRRSVEKF
jgi:hypothetical protein